jgi:filamentous hemagglutinin family protein
MKRSYRSFRNDTLAVSVMLAFASNAWALPTGGAVSAGSATIAVAPGTMTIGQTSQNVAINWQGFNIGQGEAVRFVQPNSSSVALNRVLGSDPSSILGSLSANGKVFLLNPNGILFGAGAQVNVGALVASTLNITDGDFMAGRYKFAGSGGGAILNQGTINAADGGYVALLGANVSNAGVIVASLGTVALAAGNAVTLDVAGDGLLNVTVDQGAVNALVQNGGLIRADGGQVLLSAHAAGDLLHTVVNNTGVIQAQTLQNRNGTIKLLGDMQSGTTNVGGTLDASAPNGGNGGFIETSAAHVRIASDARITTAAPLGTTGTWLIDPIDFNIQALGGDMTGPQLTALLVNNNVTISTQVTGTNTATTFFAAPGQGDINVNDEIGALASWTAAGATTTLTLNSARDVNINQAISATNGNLVVCCGRDINVRAAVTTTNGSVLLNAARDINLLLGSAMTTTNGNITLCAGHDVNVASKITLTQTTGIIPAQSLGLSRGLVFIAGTAASEPGPASGTVILPLAGALRPSVTGESAVTPAPILITYNPASYQAGGQTDYSTSLIMVDAVLTQFMAVYPGVVDKTANGSTTATLAGFKSTALSGLVPGTVTLVPGPLAAANFDTAAAGVGKPVTYSDFSLAQNPIVNGGLGLNFALPIACCGPLVGRTSGNILPIAPVAAVAPLINTTPPVVVAGLVPTFFTMPGLPLTVTEAPLPTMTFAQTPPEEAPVQVTAPVPPPVEAPVVAPPVRPVPVPRPPRQDRN